MWKLTFGLKDSEWPTFEAAFAELKRLWSSEGGGSWQMLETIWITNPNTGSPMFYQEICNTADAMNLP